MTKAQNHPVALELSSEEQPGPENAVDLTKQEFVGEISELDKLIHTMMSRGENMVKKGNLMTKAYMCQVCGKEGLITVIKNHIEANHIEGISIPCNLCENKFRSRVALKMHKMRQHIQ